MKELYGLSRRQFVRAAGFAGAGLIVPGSTAAQHTMSMPSAAPAAENANEPADITLRIGPVLLAVTDEKTISTIGYNGQVPGPLIRLKQGKTVSVQVINDTDTPEFLHWHGQFIPSNVDGAGEEKSIVVPAHGQIRYSFTPRPAGFRWFHTHVMPGSNLYGGLYSGEFGLVYIESSDEKGDFDQESFLGYTRV
jgi:FtsP/CotA-like multicopper oxidase with cupredoxin domain